MFSEESIFTDMLGVSKYNQMIYYNMFKYNKKYIHKNNIIYNKKDRAYLKETIHDVFDKPDYKELPHNCPNCGSAQKNEVFETDGCPYCQTKFVVSDLFPRVSSFYFMKSSDDGSIINFVKEKVIKQCMSSSD